jgi:hypothetical protein
MVRTSRAFHNSDYRRGSRRSPPPFPGPTNRQLADALDALVTCLLMWRRRPREEDAIPQLKALEMSRLRATPEEVVALRCLADHPVDVALKKAMKEVGGHLGERVPFDALLATVKEVCLRDSENADLRMSIFNSALDGVVTRDGDRWIA